MDIITKYFKRLTFFFFISLSSISLSCPFWIKSPLRRVILRCKLNKQMKKFAQKSFPQGHIAPDCFFFFYFFFFPSLSNINFWTSFVRSREECVKTACFSKRVHLSIISLSLTHSKDAAESGINGGNWRSWFLCYLQLCEAVTATEACTRSKRNLWFSWTAFHLPAISQFYFL